MALWTWAPAFLEDTAMESEGEAPVDEVLPGSVCSGPLPAPGSALLRTPRKVEGPECKVEGPERAAAAPTARDASRDTPRKRLPRKQPVHLVHSTMRFRLRGKRPVQKAQQFLPAPGSGLLPPGAPRCPFQPPGPPPKRPRQASPEGATPDKKTRVARAEQPGGGSAPAEQPGGTIDKTRAKYGTAQTFAGRRPPKDPERRKLFDDVRFEYYRQKAQDRKMGRSGRIYSEHKYHKFMKLKMAELASNGTSGAERMKLAAAAWSEQKYE